MFRYWPEIYQTCRFNRSEEEGALAATISRREIIEFYERNIVNPQRAKVFYFTSHRTYNTACLVKFSNPPTRYLSSN